MTNEIMTPPIPIPDPKLRQNQPLILSQLSLIMIILVVGLVIGTLAFVVEIFQKRKIDGQTSLTNGIELSVGNVGLRDLATDGTKSS